MEIKVEVEKEGEEKEMSEWELECKARTLIEAEEIKADKELMDKIRPYLDKKVAALKKISSLAELKAVAKKKSMEE